MQRNLNLNCPRILVKLCGSPGDFQMNAPFLFCLLSPLLKKSGSLCKQSNPLYHRIPYTMFLWCCFFFGGGGVHFSEDLTLCNKILKHMKLSKWKPSDLFFICLFHCFYNRIYDNVTSLWIILIDQSKFHKNMFHYNTIQYFRIFNEPLKRTLQFWTFWSFDAHSQYLYIISVFWIKLYSQGNANEQLLKMRRFCFGEMSDKK